jgi:hypothetical protein
MAPDHEHDPRRGDEYAHADGTRETVFAVADGRVLTVREYRTVDDFEESVERASYRGVNENVAELSLADYESDD